MQKLGILVHVFQHGNVRTKDLFVFDHKYPWLHGYYRLRSGQKQSGGLPLLYSDSDGPDHYVVMALVEWLREDHKGKKAPIPKDPQRIPAPLSAFQLDLPERHSSMPTNFLNGCNAELLWERLLKIKTGMGAYRSRWCGDQSSLTKPCVSPDAMLARLKALPTDELIYINIQEILNWPADMADDDFSYVFNLAPKLNPRLYWWNGPRRADFNILFGMQHIAAMQDAACLVHVQRTIGKSQKGIPMIPCPWLCNEPKEHTRHEC